MMPVNEKIKSHIRLLSMMIYSMMFGLLLFTAVSYFVIGKEAVLITNPQYAIYIATGALIVAAVLAMLANVFLKYKLIRLQQSTNTLEEYLQQNRFTHIIYLAILEAAGLIGIICFLLTGKPLALIAPCMSIVQMFLHQPTEKSNIPIR